MTSRSRSARSIMHVTTKSREIRLASRPTDWPTAENFVFGEVELGEPGDGEVLVRNTHMSVEPYMRGRMNDVKSYVPPFQVGKPLDGGAVGVVVLSRASSLPEGTWVHSNFGWREYALGPAKAFRAIDTSLVPPSAYLGVLGTPGFTAWVGLHVIGKLKASDVVFVSSAAGAVGSVAGQLAKLAGATVIGSAGSDEKVTFLTKKLGFDAAFNYHGGNVTEKLARAAPGGIDLYFENVGGEQLEAALTNLHPFGRIVACGMISSYCDDRPGPRNIFLVVSKRLTLQGFIVIDHMNRFEEFARDIAPHLATGRLVAPESFFDGLENAPRAFIELLRGGSHVGKVVVRLAPQEPNGSPK